MSQMADKLRENRLAAMAARADIHFLVYLRHPLS